MSGWLLITFVIGLSVTLGDFQSRFSKCSFYMCIRFSWLAAFSLALGELFLFLTPITVCHAIRDCQSSTEFLILLIWPLMYPFRSFWYALITSLCVLKFLSVGNSWVPFIIRETFFTLSRFFLTANVSHGTLYLALSLVDMHSAATSMWTFMKFSYSSFGVSVLNVSWKHQICFLVLSDIYC